MTSPSRAWASATAKSDLPAAVGPTTTSSRGRDAAACALGREEDTALILAYVEDVPRSSVEEAVSMSMFDNLKDKAEDLVGEHEEEVDSGVNKATDFIDEKTGGKSESITEQIDQRVDEATDKMGE